MNEKQLTEKLIEILERVSDLKASHDSLGEKVDLMLSRCSEEYSVVRKNSEEIARLETKFNMVAGICAFVSSCGIIAVIVERLL